MEAFDPSLTKTKQKFSESLIMIGHLVVEKSHSQNDSILLYHTEAFDPSLSKI